MSSDPNSWKEAKAKVAPGPIWNYRRGYDVREAGQHENEKQFRAFQFYLNSGSARSYSNTAEVLGSTEVTIRKWATTYNWHSRCAKWDQRQMAIVMKESNKIERRKHREAIEDFRKANEEQARQMMAVSNDIVGIIQKRIEKAEAEGEDIPMALVSGLLRAASNISDSGRQAWATSLGVGELMQVVEQELEEVHVEDVIDVEEIPLDE